MVTKVMASARPDRRSVICSLSHSWELGPKGWLGARLRGALPPPGVLASLGGGKGWSGVNTLRMPIYTFCAAG